MELHRGSLARHHLYDEDGEMKYFYVERKTDLGWRRVPFIEHRTRAYCDGYVDAFDSMYPSDPLRIVRSIDGSTEIVRETKGRGEVHLN